MIFWKYNDITDKSEIISVCFSVVSAEYDDVLFGIHHMWNSSIKNLLHAFN